MKKQHSIDHISTSSKILGALQIPQKIVNGQSSIEITSNREMIIDGTKGIIDYEENLIKLSLGYCTLDITGNHLTIKSLIDENIVISGFIIRIEYSF